MIVTKLANDHAWLAAALSLGLAACAVQVEDPARRVGVMEVPLRSVSADGTAFNLTGTFDLVGPEVLSDTVTLADSTIDDAALVFDPRVGSYTLTLSNWAIHEVDPTSGSSNPRTDAMLIGGAAQAVTILNNQTTTATYQFVVPGSGPINFTRGTLQVDFTIDEGLSDGSACMVAQDCASLVCNGGMCATPT